MNFRMPAVISDLSREANLEGVRLLKVWAEFSPTVPQSATPGQFDVTFESGAALTPEDPCTFHVKIGIRVLIHPNGSKELIASISADYAMTYRVKDEARFAQLTDHLVSAFSALASPMHLWAIARDLILNLSWRMNLPPTVLPSFLHDSYPGLVEGAMRALGQHEAMASVGLPRLPLT